MKRKNILTNTLNILIQVGALIWLIIYNEDLSCMLCYSGTFIPTLLLPITIILVGIINIIIGIKNKNKSKALLVLYIITGILFFTQLVSLFFALDVFDEVFHILLIINYVAIYLFTIPLFILNRKIPKNDKKIKYDIIIFIIGIMMIISAILLPKIPLNKLRNLFDNEMISNNEENETGYVEVLDGDEIRFINEDNGKIEFSIKGDYVYQVGYLTNVRYLNYAVIRNGNYIEIWNINNKSDIKQIYKYDDTADKISNYLDILDLVGGFVHTHWNTIEVKKEYEDESKRLYKTKPIESTKKYEESQDLYYTYYSNSDITIQIASTELNAEDDKTAEKEIYLIKREADQKIKLDCQNLLYRYDENNSKYIYIYDNNYIAYINDDTNGYFNMQGEKVAEINNSYIFLDINPESSLVAKVDKDYENKIEEYEYDYEQDGLQLMLLDNELNIISDVYSDGRILKNFYALDDSLWTRTGKQLSEEAQLLAEINENKIIAARCNKGAIIFDLNGNQKEYNQIFANTDRWAWNEENNIEDIYIQYMRQM